MDEAESKALIEELIAFATQPHFIYAHKWRQGDILIWDNRCTLHQRQPSSTTATTSATCAGRRSTSRRGPQRDLPRGLHLGMVRNPRRRPEPPVYASTRHSMA
jgi:hypothetical protein